MVEQLAPGVPRYPAGSSQWWIARLSAALISRQERFDLLARYYRGTQDLSLLASQAWQESGMAGRFPAYLSANYSRLIINAAAQRLLVLGFRAGNSVDVDEQMARIWTANDMEELADVAITSSMIFGECPVLVEPNPIDNETPIITPQDPNSTIVWHASGDRRIREAAMKTWWDPDERRRFYILYLPNRIQRWRDASPRDYDRWAQHLNPEATDVWELVDGGDGINPLREVPMVVIRNEALSSGSPEAEHESSLNQIDLYNKTLMDMAVTSQELSWPQRYATGVNQDADEEVEEAEGGQPVASSRPQTGQSRWITTDNPEAQFGQFVAASLDGYVKMLDLIRASIGTTSFTPYHFLLNMPSSVPPSGESITASDAAPTDKAKRHQRSKGVSFRSIARLVFRVAGDESRARAIAAGSVVWADPERRTESQHIDALGKMRQMLGVPEEATWELIPASPEQIARWREMKAAEPAPQIEPSVIPSGDGSPDTNSDTPPQAEEI